MSTAFEKTFSQRHDFEVVHEPFTDCYYFGHARRSNRYGDQPSRSGYGTAEAYEAVFKPTAKRIFVKELCFQAEPFLEQAFIERVTSTFIVRSPDVVLSSLAPLKPDFTEDEFGYTALERVWKRVTSAFDSPPVVIEGDQFRNNPHETLKAYCRRVRVPFNASMLYWDDGAIRRWDPHERESQAKWHRTLESSHNILPAMQNRKVIIPPHLRSAFRRAERVYEMIASSPGVIAYDAVAAKYSAVRYPAPAGQVGSDQTMSGVDP